MLHFSSEMIENLIKNNKKLIFVDDDIYDITDFVHPFNIDPITSQINSNVKNDYNFHGSNAKKLWKKYKIGTKKKSICNIM